MASPSTSPTKPGTPLSAILLVVFCTLLTSGGQLLLKIGTQNIQANWQAIITNYALLGGIILYGLGALTYIIALRHGELSILAPFIALSFIWVMILSIFILHEQVVLLNWAGVALILVGVSLIGRGTSSTPEPEKIPKLGKKGALKRGAHLAKNGGFP